MSQQDRNMAGLKRVVEADAHHDYLELACGAKPQRTCQFKKLSERIMKTVDAVHLDIGSTEECRQKCLDASFGCYTYEHISAGEPTGICRLSHHSTATLAHIQEPYWSAENATTYELQACKQVGPRRPQRRSLPGLRGAGVDRWDVARSALRHATGSRLQGPSRLPPLVWVPWVL